MPVADLTVSASNDGPWTAGGVGTYTLVVSTSPTFDQSDKLVNLAHTLPTGLTPESAAGDGWSCSVSGRKVTCLSRLTVAPGDSYPPVVIKVLVGRHVAGPVSADSGVSVAGAEADTTNNTATSTTTVN
ncbi:MAG TPA: hypothetical protein VM677_00815 [Actinokineospora sp.]|jgi:hypothetical protein|nr:hypothetical protein [Actinokineospora sp.]